jgi:hypothetical protein
MSDAWKVILKGTNEAGNEVLLKVTEDGKLQVEEQKRVTSWVNYDGTTTGGATVTTIEPTSNALSVELALDSDQPESLLYSLNGGSSWMTLQPGETTCKDCDQATVKLKSVTDAVNYRCNIGI